MAQAWKRRLLLDNTLQADRLPNGESGGAARVVPIDFGTDWSAKIGNCDVRMKADGVKTASTTEEVSSHSVEQRHRSQKWDRDTCRAAENATLEWEKRIAN